MPMPRRRSSRPFAVAAVAALALVPAPAAARALDASAAPAAPRLVTLSDERLHTRWAHPARLTDVRRRHDATSRAVGRLRFFTEDGFPEVYLLLRRYTDDRGREWVQIRVPKRPNGTTGWVPRDALGPFTLNRHLLTVSRATLRATLYDRGRRVWTARVGVGAPGTRTPAGRFWVREKLRFRHTPLYGTHALGTSAYAPTLSDWPNGGVVGIHGTDQPELIPGRPSHGCIRVRNADIARLWRLIPVGTPVHIT